MKRAVLARGVASRVAPSDVVVCSLGTANRAWREQHAPNPSYYASDPMGMAPGMALGIALARPDREVVLLEGDGDLLMNLGVLVTIAGARPRNLRVVIFRNHRYETGGGQPLAGGEAVDLVHMAASAGWSFAEDVEEEEDLDDALGRLLGSAGPGLIVVRVETQASPYPTAGELSKVEERTLFQQLLAGGHA